MSSSTSLSDIFCASCRHTATDLAAGHKMFRCTACKAVYYCSTEHQKSNWKIHKPACTSVTTSKPYIVHIDFGREVSDNSPWCKTLVDSLAIPYSRTYAVADTPAKALAILDHPVPPKCILFSSGEIDADGHAELRAQLRKYVEKGGRLVLGGPLCNFIATPKIQSVLSDLGAPEWRFGGYHRTTFALNLGHPLYDALPGNSTARAALPSSYSIKSVFLAGVPRGEALYQTTKDSKSESIIAMMRPMIAVTDDEVAVAAKKVGEGWLAWVGDVNQEQGSTMATLVLLGVKE
ncbi:hypothetical protein JCM10207_004641 [Rhodosporidiobolus poonsookiae]